MSWKALRIVKCHLLVRMPPFFRWHAGAGTVPGPAGTAAPLSQTPKWPFASRPSRSSCSRRNCSWRSRRDAEEMSFVIAYRTSPSSGSISNVQPPRKKYLSASEPAASRSFRLSRCVIITSSSVLVRPSRRTRIVGRMAWTSNFLSPSHRSMPRTQPILCRETRSFQCTGTGRQMSVQVAAKLPFPMEVVATASGGPHPVALSKRRPGLRHRPRRQFRLIRR